MGNFMKNIFWIICILNFVNIFCPGEAPAYMGLHLGDRSERSETHIKEQKQEKQKEEEEGLFKKHFRKISDSIRHWVTKKLSAQVAQSSYRIQDPVWMHDNPYENEDETKEVQEGIRIEQEQKVQDELKKIKEKTLWESAKDTAVLWLRTLKTFKHIFESTRNVPKVPGDFVDKNKIPVSQEVDDEKKALKLLESFDSNSIDEDRLSEFTKISLKLPREARQEILEIFKEKQNITRQVLYKQFENIDNLFSGAAKEGKKILLLQARDTILLELPAAYDKMEIALGLKTEKQITTLNEIFKTIKIIKPDQDISTLLIEIDASHLDQGDLENLYQRIGDQQRILVIASTLDPEGLKRGMYGVKVDSDNLEVLNNKFKEIKKSLKTKIKLLQIGQKK
jgi:hypothetical protein